MGRLTHAEWQVRVLGSQVTEAELRMSADGWWQAMILVQAEWKDLDPEEKRSLVVSWLAESTGVRLHARSLEAIVAGYLWMAELDLQD